MHFGIRLTAFFRINDPFNGVTNPKYIPGAVAQYTILIISNSGAGTVTNNSIVITDPIPANTTLFTGGLNAGCWCTLHLY